MAAYEKKVREVLLGKILKSIFTILATLLFFKNVRT